QETLSLPVCAATPHKRGEKKRSGAAWPPPDPHRAAPVRGGCMDTPDLDLLAIGEALVDFISQEPADSLSAAEQFRRYLGGSPANVAVTVARLCGRAAIASKVGAGAFGRFVRGELE